MSPYQAEVAEHFTKELSHVDMTTFTEKEIDSMGMASEQGCLDWDWDRDDTREMWATMEDAAYSYFFATYEDIISSSAYENRQ